MIPLRFSGFTIFQPTRPLRGATGGQGGILSLSPYFNPRAPCGARHDRHGGHGRGCGISTHAPLAGRDGIRQPFICVYVRFQPTRPLRGATFKGEVILRHVEFQPTRPLRGATMLHLYALLYQRISTHAPLAGRDRHGLPPCHLQAHISTHAPLAGRDVGREYPLHHHKISTHAPLAGRDPTAADF